MELFALNCPEYRYSNLSDRLKPYLPGAVHVSSMVQVDQFGKILICCHGFRLVQGQELRYNKLFRTYHFDEDLNLDQQQQKFTCLMLNILMICL